MLSKIMLVTVFMAVAVLSAESCAGAAKAQECLSIATKGGEPCSVLNELTSCIENKLSGCDQSTIKGLKSAMTAGLAGTNCKSSPSPSPKPAPSPTPSSVPSPAEEASSAACASLNLQQKMTECQAPMMQAAQSGNMCGGWNNFQCCLIDSVASCGKDMQDRVKGMVDQTSKTFSGMPGFASLDGCGAASCASSAPAPEKVTAVMAGITLSNPRDFDLETFETAVKKRTGASNVQAVLKAFEIVAKYSVPDTMDLSPLKAAIAKANSVQESQIDVEKSGRRLSTQRLLAAKTTDVDVTITVPGPDAEKAVAVKETAANVSKLGDELGQTVTISKAPQAIAKVETTVTSDASLTADTLTSKMTEVGTDVGGKVTVTEVLPLAHDSSSASSSFGALLAPAMIVLTVMLAM